MGFNWPCPLGWGHSPPFDMVTSMDVLPYQICSLEVKPYVRRQWVPKHLGDAGRPVATFRHEEAIASSFLVV